MEQNILVKSDGKKAHFAPGLTGVPVQRRLAPKTQDQTAFDDIRVRYSLNDANFQSHPAVIQRKQIVPLADRLQKFDADVSAENPEFKTLLEDYDAINNVRETTLAQLICLKDMFDIVAKMDGDKAHRAKKILGDEYFFVCKQNYDSPFDQNEDPWEHMDDSPFIRSLQFLAEKFGVLSGGDQPTARRLIARMSNLHSIRLTPNESEFGDEGIAAINKCWVRVQRCILTDGVLAHYTHRGDISILHSTDYLKANNLLARDAKETMNPTEGQVVTKSMRIDTENIKNTGFVFMFLERKNAKFRPSDFGLYRYCVPLDNYGMGLLAQGWAILHDLAGAPKHPEGKDLESTVDRTLQGTTNPGMERPDQIKKEVEIWATKNPNWMKGINKQQMLEMITLMLPIAQYSTSFTSRNEKKEYNHPLESGVSDHYFVGADIIPGISLRIARELYMLSQFSTEEYERVTASNDSLWKYISNVVFDMQIMLPVSVMPEDVQPKLGASM